METRHIAVINQSHQLTLSSVERAVAAVQKQVLLDFAPVWQVTAVVSLFSSLADRPAGYWPVVLRDDIGINAPGAHASADGTKPFALVLFTGDDWTITLSHEVLEMLIDPLGKARIAGPSPRPGAADVEYLVELCDPCQDARCAYLVNGDQWVSDFVFPAFYTGSGQGKFSQNGSIVEPRHVVAGGYMTWQELATGEWWQALDDGQGTQFRQLDPGELLANVHLRGWVDRTTRATWPKRRKKIANPYLERMAKRNRQRADAYGDVREARAAWYQAQLDRVAPRDPA